MNARDSILAAGVALLKEKGIAALTQPQVAKAAGLSQSHLTYYFPTRSALLLGVAEHSIDTILGSLAAMPQQGALAMRLADFVIEGVPPRVFIGLIVAADSDPEIRPSLRRLVEHVRHQVEALLAKNGLTAGEDAALLFHAAVVGLAVLHQAQTSDRSAAEVRGGIAAMLQLLASQGKEGLHD